MSELLNGLHKWELVETEKAPEYCLVADRTAETIIYSGKDKATARLIQVAPSMFRHLFRAYGYLLKHMPLSHRATMTGQVLLSGMRGDLSYASGCEDIQVEEYAKAAAHDFGDGDDGKGEAFDSLMKNHEMLLNCYNKLCAGAGTEEEFLKELRSEMVNTLTAIEKLKLK